MKKIKLLSLALLTLVLISLAPLSVFAETDTTIWWGWYGFDIVGNYLTIDAGYDDDLMTENDERYNWQLIYSSSPIIYDNSTHKYEPSSYTIIGGRTFDKPTHHSFLLSDVGYYSVLVYRSSSIIETDPTPPQFYYSGASRDIMPKANIWYDYDNNIIYSYNIPTVGNPRVNVYRDGARIHVLNGEYSYSPTISGTYQFQFVDYDSVYLNGELSNSIYINLSPPSPIEPDTPDKPISPDDGNILEWLAYFVDMISYYVNLVITSIVNIFTSSVSAIQNLIGYVTDFISSIGGLFDFLPTELKVLFISAISVTLIFMVIHFLKP